MKLFFFVLFSFCYLLHQTKKANIFDSEAVKAKFKAMGFDEKEFLTPKEFKDFLLQVIANNAPVNPFHEALKNKYFEIVTLPSQIEKKNFAKYLDMAIINECMIEVVRTQYGEEYVEAVKQTIQENLQGIEKEIDEELAKEDQGENVEENVENKAEEKIEIKAGEKVEVKAEEKVEIRAEEKVEVKAEEKVEIRVEEKVEEKAVGDKVDL